MRIILIAVMLILSNTLFGQLTPLHIEIHNFKNNEGSVIISVFKDQKSFEEKIPDEYFYLSKKEYLSQGFFKTTLRLPPDTYGIAVVDDENNDKKMNYNWLGIPEEGFGFSNYYHTGMSRPTFSDFSFDLKEQTNKMKIKVKYM